MRLSIPALVVLAVASAPAARAADSVVLLESGGEIFLGGEFHLRFDDLGNLVVHQGSQANLMTNRKGRAYERYWLEKDQDGNFMIFAMAKGGFLPVLLWASPEVDPGFNSKFTITGTWDKWRFNVRRADGKDVEIGSGPRSGSAPPPSKEPAPDSPVPLPAGFPDLSGMLPGGLKIPR